MPLMYKWNSAVAAELCELFSRRVVQTARFTQHFLVLLLTLIISPIILTIPNVMVLMIDHFATHSRINRSNTFIRKILSKTIQTLKTLLAICHIFTIKTIVQSFQYFFEVRIHTNGLDYDLLDRTNIILSNHLSCFDWVYMYLLFAASNNISFRRVKFFLKHEVEKLPFMGSICHILDHCFLYRDYKKDSKVLDLFFNANKDAHKDQFVIYPEGRIKLPHVMENSDKFAASYNLPKLKNCSYPKAKGFREVVGRIKNCYDSETEAIRDENSEYDGSKILLCDVTIYLTGNYPVCELEVLNKRNYDLYIDFEFTDITNTLMKQCDDYDKVKDYLFKMWQSKDKKLERFINSPEKCLVNFEPFESDKNRAIIFFVGTMLLVSLAFRIIFSSFQFALIYTCLTIYCHLWMMRNYRKPNF